MVVKFRQVWIYESDYDDLINIIQPLVQKKYSYFKERKVPKAVLLKECIQTIVENKNKLK